MYAGLFLLSSCAAAAGPSRDIVLRVDPVAPAPTSPAALEIIALAPVRASVSASGRRYTYIIPSAPREVRVAATLFWEEPPPVMVERAVVRGLSARLGSPVIDNMIGLGAAPRLTVDLERFEEASGPSAQAIVAVHATLVDAKTHGLLFDAHFCRSSPILGATPTDRSRAFENALNQLLDDLAARISSGKDRTRAAPC